jgi:hypothetical protein
MTRPLNHGTGRKKPRRRFGDLGPLLYLNERCYMRVQLWFISLKTDWCTGLPCVPLIAIIFVLFLHCCGKG